jgi:hypothetical protein
VPSVDRRRRPGGLRRPLLTRVLLASLVASVLWLTIGLGLSATGASVPGPGRPSVAAGAAAGAAPGHHNGHARGHKQGTFAVAASVVGIVVVVVLIFLLGSLSVRRRLGDSPIIRRRGPRGPPETGRGLFG